MRKLSRQKSPTIQLLKHQVDFVTSLNPKFIGLVGGYRSGKTYALCHKAVYLASQNIGYDGALLEPTHSMLRRVMVPTLNKVLTEIKLPYTYLSSVGTYTLHFPDGDALIHLLAAENYTRIAGTSLAWFGVDEFDLINKELAEEAWRMLVSRLTKANSMQGCITSTPEGFNFLNWFFNEDGVDKDGNPKKDRRLILAKTRDNPFIDPDYIQTMKDQYPAKLLEAYLEGKFTNLASGNVYYNFDRALNCTSHVEADFHETWPLCVAVDFNINKMATVLSFINPMGQVTVVNEIYGEANTESLIRKLKQLYPKRRMILFCDASGNRTVSASSVSDIALFSNAGFDVSNIDRSNPLIQDRVNSVNAKLCNSLGMRSILINVQRCPQLVKGLEQQGYVDGKPDKSGDLDHSLDALGYMIYKKFPLKSLKGGRIIVNP